MGDSFMNTVEQISELILKVASLQKPHVDRMCGSCASPCCLRVHYLYSSTEIRFMRLAGIERPWSGKAFLHGGCWFLGSAGCTLEPVARPMLCHSYLCPELKTAMAEADAGLPPALKKRFAEIRKLRKRLVSPKEEPADSMRTQQENQHTGGASVTEQQFPVKHSFTQHPP